MSSTFELVAELREDEGKGASRRLRREGKVPAVLYGGGRAPRSITLNFHELTNQSRKEAFFSHVLNIRVGKVAQKAIVKDMQVHPAKNRIMHVDFQRVMAGQEIRMTVPLHFMNEETAPGAKLLGGVFSHLKNEVDIACLPKDLPEYIEIDVGEMELDTMLHVSDIKLPDGVVIPELAQGPEHDQPVITLQVPKKVVEEDETEATPDEPEPDAPESEDPANS